MVGQDRAQEHFEHISITFFNFLHYIGEQLYNLIRLVHLLGTGEQATNLRLQPCYNLIAFGLHPAHALLEVDRQVGGNEVSEGPLCVK